jgi:hypothetical protein
LALLLKVPVVLYFSDSEDHIETTISYEKPSSEPDIDEGTFVQFIQGSKSEWPAIIDAMFHYWAYVHNPKLNDRYAIKLANACNLDENAVLLCWDALSKRSTSRAQNMGANIETDNHLTMIDAKKLESLPKEIVDNLLCLLAQKRNVSFGNMREQDLSVEDGYYSAPVRFASSEIVFFNETVKIANELLKQRGSPKYSIERYAFFPKNGPNIAFNPDAFGAG